MSPCNHTKDHVLRWSKPPTWLMLHSGEEMSMLIHQDHPGAWQDTLSSTNSPLPGKKNHGVSLERPSQPLLTGSLKPSLPSWRQ